MKKVQLKALIDKYLDGSATQDEIALLFRQYALLEEKFPKWDNVHMGDEATVKARIFSTITQNALTNDTIRPVWWRNWQFTAAAAVLIFVGVAFSLFRYQRNLAKKLINAGNNAVLVVDSKRMEQLTLPDGTQVWLAENSRLTYPKKFADSARVIGLSGQAYFDVSHNPSHPFVIKTGTLETRVLGTRLVIRALTSESNVKVAVVAGKVQVSTTTDKAQFLTGYQQVVYNKVSHSLVQQPILNMAELLAWTGKKITYRNTRLANVATELARIYGITVNVRKELAGCQIHADFLYSDSPDQILQFLAASLNGTVTKTKGGYTLSGKGCN